MATNAPSPANKAPPTNLHNNVYEMVESELRVRLQSADLSVAHLQEDLAQYSLNPSMMSKDIGKLLQTPLQIEDKELRATFVLEDKSDYG